MTAGNSSISSSSGLMPVNPSAGSSLMTGGSSSGGSSSGGSPRRTSIAGDAWIGGDMPFARFGLIVNLLVPIFLLVWDAFNHALGADPVNFAIHTTGIIALIYLLLSLAVTPLRTITGFNWLIQFRRSLGVYAFYYAAIHLTIYFFWDESGSISSTAYEIFHRYYLTIGFASLAIMTPLWATSLNVAIRKMGGKNWKRLHRFTYLAAALGCIHFYLQSKADKRRPDLFLAVLGALLLWRVGSALVQRARRRAKAEMAAKSAAAARTAGASGGKVRFWKGPMRVVGMFQETPTVRTFRLAPADGGPVPFAFSAGQFLSLAVEIDGKRVTRSYTIASPPTRDGYIELSIKREDRGQVSRFLHDKLMTGQTIAVSAPSGRFSFKPAPVMYGAANDPGAAVLLIAGGVGITPVMSILRHLTDICWPGKIDMVFSVRGPEDVIFADELKYLASRHPNVHVHLTITREGATEWTGLRGRITAELLGRIIPDFVARPAFICGPDAMARGTRDVLIAAGVPAARITLESFTPAAAMGAGAGGAGTTVEGAAASADPASDGVANVTFSTSGQTVALSPGQSILEAAESVGVHIDFDCRSGICGQCRSKLTSGHVKMTVRDALSDADEADGYILACQSHATEDCTVEA
jgi:ferredoxin-NADP reductase/DMSO/TMAO reductase YedYZ heme-binding membrane subunit